MTALAMLVLTLAPVITTSAFNDGIQATDVLRAREFCRPGEVRRVTVRQVWSVGTVTGCVAG
jgi:hypothetical protein